MFWLLDPRATNQPERGLNPSTVVFFEGPTLTDRKLNNFSSLAATISNGLKGGSKSSPRLGVTLPRVVAPEPYRLALTLSSNGLLNIPILWTGPFVLLFVVDS